MIMKTLTKLKMGFNKYLKSPKTHWQNYKDLFQITVFKYLVTWFAIVPFLAILFIKLPQEIKIDILHTTIEYSFNIGLPFTWQLLWVSSLCFVSAFILYLIYCPTFIRKYNSFKDYVAMMHSPRWIIWESKNILKNKMDIPKFFSRISTKKYIDSISINDFESIRNDYNKNKNKSSEDFDKFGVIVEEKQTKLYFLYENKAYSLGLPRLTNQPEELDQTKLVEQEIFWEVFARYSASSPIIRLIILILLAISGILFGIVLLQNIVSGICLIIN